MGVTLSRQNHQRSKPRHPSFSKWEEHVRVNHIPFDGASSFVIPIHKYGELMPALSGVCNVEHHQSACCSISQDIDFHFLIF